MEARDTAGACGTHALAPTQPRSAQGVQIGGKEYAYGRVQPQLDSEMHVMNATATGVWSQNPRELPASMAGATFKETIEAGTATLSPGQLRARER